MRACVHRDFRTGIVLGLLWRGIQAYIQRVQADYLFGCASIRSMKASGIAALHHYLGSKGFLLEDSSTKALPEYQMPGFEQALEQSADLALGKSLLPPLLNSYLRAGAKVGRHPALDVSFECVDFLTILKLADLSALFERKYTL